MTQETERRPRVSDPSVLMAAAGRLADQMISEGLIDEPDRAETIDAISKHGRYGRDGYDLMRALERHCFWDGSAEMVAALDELTPYIGNALADAEMEWADRTAQQPTFGPGDRVSFGHNETGVIDRIYEHGAAKYCIAVDGDPTAAPPRNSRRLVNFEDVRPVEAKAETAS